ncbi:MAG: hypothetical protein U1E78_07195 [Gammaproteobacteria bacterium]
MIFKPFSFQDIRPPLGLARLFCLTITEDEFRRCHNLLQTLNDSNNPLKAEFNLALTQHLIAGDYAWLEQFQERLSQDLERQEGMLSFFAWVKPLFFPLYERRVAVKQSLLENQTALKQLKQTLKNKLLILLEQNRHSQNALAPEIVLSFEKWLMAYYPDSVLPALSLSQTYLPQDYCPIVSPVTTLKHLTDAQTLVKELKADHPLTPLSQLSLRSIFDTFKEEVKRPGYGLRKLPILITGALSAYLGLPILLTLGIFFYALFRNTTLALWGGAQSVYQHLQWSYQRLTREDQLTHLIHFGPYLLQLEDTAIFCRDWLATGPLDLATLDTAFYQQTINERLDSLTHALTELNTLGASAHHLSDRKIYQVLATQIEQAKDRLIETAEGFTHQIAHQAKIAFRLPGSTHLKPRLSPEQIQNLRDFVVSFGAERDLNAFDNNTDAIQLFLNTLNNPSSSIHLTLPFATPKEHRTILPFGTHKVNKTALKLNKHFVLRYETSPQKALAFKGIISILKGKKAATQAQIKSYLEIIGATEINQTLKHIRHHLFLTQDTFTGSETDCFTTEEKVKITNWYKNYRKSIHQCLDSLWGWFESKDTFTTQTAENAALVLKGHAAYQQIRQKKPRIIISQAQERIMALIATFKGEHRGFLSFIFPFWDNAPPQGLLDGCLKKRLEYALDHPCKKEKTILLDDLTLHLPSPRLHLLSFWAERKLSGQASYSAAVEKNVLTPLSERGFINEETIIQYRRKGLNQLLSSKE